MTTNRSVTHNVCWNWAGMGVGLAVGVVLMPFLIQRLGKETYGLWILIASLTSYFGLLDLGVRGSVGRYIAFHRARNDRDGVNRALSTAMLLLVGVAVLAFLGTLGLQLAFFRPFDISPEQANSVRWALFIVGVNLALTFPLSVFDGTLWAFQRFDVLNRVDIPINLARLGLTFVWISSGGGLVALAVITLGTTLAAGAAKAFLCFQEDSGLRLSPVLAEKTMAWALLAFGFWSFLQAMAFMVSTQMGLLITGAWLGFTYVTTFNIALRLVNIASAFLMAGTGVLTPVATALHAVRNDEQQRRLFLDGGRFCTAFALYFATLLVFLGEPLILLWVGPDLVQAADLLTVMALGLILPFSQRVTNSMILGMGRHKLMALVALAESVLSTIAAILLARPFGLMGICVAFVAGECLGRGVIQLLYGCRLVRMNVGRYLRHALVVPLAVAAVPAIGLGVLTRYWMPANWAGLILTTAGFSVIYVVFVVGAFIPGWFRHLPGRRDKPAVPEPAVAATHPIPDTEGCLCRM